MNQPKQMLDLVFQYVKRMDLDGNQYVDFKIVQKALNKAMMAKELLLSCWQASKSVWIL